MVHHQITFADGAVFDVPQGGIVQVTQRGWLRVAWQEERGDHVREYPPTAVKVWMSYTQKGLT